jgi:2-C-methyl-D-erythritol 4-phosphate cytidylyltransferase
MSWHLIIVSGGSGKRFGAAAPKQFLLLKNQPILHWALNAFRPFDPASAVLVAHPDWMVESKKILDSVFKDRCATKTVEGGIFRQQSSWNGLQSLKASDNEIVLIHDAARPIMPAALIERVIAAAKDCGAAIPGTGAKDSLVLCEGAFVQKYLDRNDVRHVQTPQGFRIEIIRDSHERAEKDGLLDAPDDASLVLRAGYPVKIVEGDPRNIKITFKEDLDASAVYLEDLIPPAASQR